MKGDLDEARTMTALISGYVAASVMKMEEFLTKPFTLTRSDPDGVVQFELASGMLVTITVAIEPVGQVKGRQIRIGRLDI